jgi:hypothetical protein
VTQCKQEGARWSTGVPLGTSLPEIHSKWTTTAILVWKGLSDHRSSPLGIKVSVMAQINHQDQESFRPRMRLMYKYCKCQSNDRCPYEKREESVAALKPIVEATDSSCSNDLSFLNYTPLLERNFRAHSKSPFQIQWTHCLASVIAAEDIPQLYTLQSIFSFSWRKLFHPTWCLLLGTACIFMT